MIMVKQAEEELKQENDGGVEAQIMHSEGSDISERRGTLMYPHYARELDQSPEDGSNVKSADQNGFCHKVNYFVVHHIGAYVCNIDLGFARPLNEASKPSDKQQQQQHCQEEDDDKEEGNDDDDNNNNLRKRDEARGYFGTLKKTEWKRQLRFGWIPRALLCVLITLSCYLLVAAYHQYTYDFELLRLLQLQRLKQQQQAPGSDYNHHELAARELQVMTRMREKRARMDWLGSNYCHLPIIVECLYLVVITRLSLYVSAQVHYSFRYFSNCHIVRALVDRRREIADSAHMVRKLIAKFLRSSRVHYAVCMQDIITLHHPSTTCKDTFTGCSAHKVCVKFRLAQESCESSRKVSEEIVHEMLAGGALKPLYNLRTWTQRRAVKLTRNSLLLAISLFLFDSSLAYGFFALEGLGDKSPNSHIVQLVCFVLLETTTYAVILHGALFMTYVADQIFYVEQLCRMIKVCIQLNEQQFEWIRKQPRVKTSCQRTRSLRMSALSEHGNSYLSSTWAPQRVDSLKRTGDTAAAANDLQVREAERLMNSNLLFTLLHYKIFVAQLAPTKCSLGFYNVIAYVLLFTTPIIARIHEPYISYLSLGRLSSAQIKIFAMVISASVLPVHDVACRPLCTMLTHCKRLYRDLSSLLAHTCKIRSYERGEHVYDSHAETCLIKELNDPARFLQKLTVSFGGFAATHTALMRSYFWYGLLIISILADFNYEQNLFSWFFNDPLRVFSRSES